MTNATVQQHIVSGLVGGEVSAVTPFLQSGHTAAVSTGLATFFESHKGGWINTTARFTMSAGIPFHKEPAGQALTDPI